MASILQRTIREMINESSSSQAAFVYWTESRDGIILHGEHGEHDEFSVSDLGEGSLVELGKRAIRTFLDDKTNAVHQGEWNVSAEPAGENSVLVRYSMIRTTGGSSAKKLS